MTMAVQRRRLLPVFAVVIAVAGGAYWFTGRADGEHTPLDGVTVGAPVGVGAAVDADALQQHLEKHPRDSRAWAILARLRFGGDRYTEAADAYRHALDLPGKVARDPLVWCEYADALAMAQGGRLAGRPVELIEHALALDPRHPRALEMAGSARVELGDYAGALQYWEMLLKVLPADSGQYRALAMAVERTRQRAGR